VVGVVDFVSRRDDLLFSRAEDFEHSFLVVTLRSRDEGFARVLRRRERFLTLLLRKGTGEKARCQKDSDSG
jgi:hypothetical protein